MYIELLMMMVSKDFLGFTHLEDLMSPGIKKLKLKGRPV